jgi:hypothetical protein
MDTTKIHEQIDKAIDSSEMVRLAWKHFDNESTEMMVEELKERIKKIVVEHTK